jgi:hypothetical protein
VREKGTKQKRRRKKKKKKEKQTKHFFAEEIRSPKSE